MLDILTVLLVVIGFVAGIFTCRAWYHHRALGTFKYDRTGETYRYRLDLGLDLDQIEKYHIAVVKIREDDLSLPGERRTQK
jgi:hypothetical protein